MDYMGTPSDLENQKRVCSEKIKEAQNQLGYIQVGLDFWKDNPTYALATRLNTACISISNRSESWGYENWETLGDAKSGMIEKIGRLNRRFTPAQVETIVRILEGKQV